MTHTFEGPLRQAQIVLRVELMARRWTIPHEAVLVHRCVLHWTLAQPLPLTRHYWTLTFDAPIPTVTQLSIFFFLNKSSNETFFILLL